MATAAASLDAAIASYAATLASVAAAGPKVSYNIDGEQVDWMEYQQFITQQMNALMKSRQDLDGAWWNIQRGIG